MEEKITEYIDEDGNKVVIIGKTTFVYKKMSDVEKAIELSEMREKALHIEATEKSYARAEGRSELLSELIKQGVITEEQANNYRDRKNKLRSDL